MVGILVVTPYQVFQHQGMQGHPFRRIFPQAARGVDGRFAPLFLNAHSCSLLALAGRGA